MKRCAVTQIKQNISKKLAGVLGLVGVAKRSSSTGRIHIPTIGAGASSVLPVFGVVLLGAICCSLMALGGHASALSIPYSITYNDGVVENMPADVSNDTLDSAVSISGTVPTRNGYTFSGWCAGDITTTDGTDSCSGTIYNPNGGGTNLSYTIDQTGANNLSLIAMWSSAPGLCTSAATCMQTATTCDTTLTDSRDGNTYTVATINGKCWMTQNLRFTGTTLTTTDSNVASDKNITWYDLASNSNCTSTSTSGNGMTYTCMKYNNNTSYGAYYNYAAATAGTITGSSNTTEAQESVCPAGWRLPTSSEFSGITSYTTAFSPVYSGYYSGGSLRSTGSSGNGYWWSSTANSGTIRYGLGYRSGSLYTNYGYRYIGDSVRCLRS